MRKGKEGCLKSGKAVSWRLLNKKREYDSSHAFGRRLEEHQDAIGR